MKAHKILTQNCTILVPFYIFCSLSLLLGIIIPFSTGLWIWSSFSKQLVLEKCSWILSTNIITAPHQPLHNAYSYSKGYTSTVIWSHSKVISWYHPTRRYINIQFWYHMWNSGLTWNSYPSSPPCRIVVCGFIHIHIHCIYIYMCS